MSIVDDLNKINNIKIDIKQAIRDKGVEMEDNTPFAEYPNLIRNIETDSGDNGGDSGSGEGGNSFYEDFYNMKTNNGTNYSNLFDNYQGTELDLSGLDTSQVTSMNSMFRMCTNLQSLDLSNFNTSNVTNMAWMFESCRSLKVLDLSNWDTSGLERNEWGYNYGMDQFLGMCDNLIELHLDNCSYDTINDIINSMGFPGMDMGVTRVIYCKAENSEGLMPPYPWVFVEPLPLYVPGEFQNNTDITEVEVMVDESHTNLGNMFNGCSNLTKVNTEDWDVSNVTNMSCMFCNCYNLTELDLSSWDTSKVTDMYRMFNGCNNLRTLYLADCDIDTIRQLLENANLPTRNENDGVINVTDIPEGIVAPEGWTFVKYIPLYVPGEFRGNMMYPVDPEAPFEPFEAVTMVNETHTDLSYMFERRYDLVSVNTQDWNTCNVTTMSWMFYDCQNLPELDLSNWDTINVTDMTSMFSGCRKLTQVDTSNWDTSNVTTMNTMFGNCFSLESIIGIEDWETYNVTDMNGMFQDCQFTELDLSNWNTSNVTTMSWMFGNCASLERLDIRNWDTSNIGDEWNIYYFLNGCPNLRELRLDNCSYDTIDRIINSFEFPVNNYGTIYCREENAPGAPGNWTIEFVSGESDPDYINSGNPYIRTKFNTEYYDHMMGESGYQWEYSFDGIIWHNNDECNGYIEEEERYTGATTEGHETIYFRPRVDRNEDEDIPMYRLFEDVNGLLEVEFYNFEDSRVNQHVDHMFMNTNITNVDLSWMNVEEIYNVDYMFSGCSSLRTVDIRNFNISNEYGGDSESEITNMFTDCISLRELRLDNCNHDTIEKIINSTYFPYASILGITKTIYCKESEVEGLEPPGYWVFSYVD